MTGTVIGGIHSSGLVGGVGAGSTNTISNCWVKTSVIINGSHGGGIVGHGGTSTTTIENCLFDGSISGATTATGVVYGWGDTGKAILTNCYATGNISGGIDLARKNNGSPYVTNCYKSFSSGSYGTYTTDTGTVLKDLLGGKWKTNGSNVVPAVFADTGSGNSFIELGEGEETNEYLPCNSFYEYSYTQQIYTAQEIGVSGSIVSIAFKNTSTANTRTIALYMKHTEKNTFESGSDWVPMSDADLVYSGDVTFEQGEWTTITLDSPFDYDGNYNLIVAVADNTGTYSLSKLSCVVYDAPGQAIDAFTDEGAYNVENCGVFGWVDNVKNRIQLDIAASTGSNDGKPMWLKALDVASYNVTLLWTGGYGDYNVEYKKLADTEWTPVNGPWTGANGQYSTTLTGLEPNTTYQARVQSVYNGSSASGWKGVKFTTLVSYPTPADLAVTLTPGDVDRATLSWKEKGTATQWQICLNNDENNLITTNSNPFTLTGLTPETVYTARVRAVGNGEYSRWGNAVSFLPTNASLLTVNDGIITNGEVPIYGDFVRSYSASQFIIPATDLSTMQGSEIIRLAFYSPYNSVDWGNAPFEVYMKEVDYTTFAGGTMVDWNDMELVRNAGSLSVSGNTMRVLLDYPYPYSGRNLLVGLRVARQNPSANEHTSSWYGVQTKDNASLGKYNDKVYSQNGFLPKTTFSYIQKECMRPLSVKAIYTGGTTAVVSWTSDATAFNVNVNGTVTAHPQVAKADGKWSMTLTGLDMATEYTVSVQTDCGGSTSEWSPPAIFTTDCCMPEDQCVISYELHDSYGDGWNGNAIQVVDVATGILLSTWTIDKGKSASGSLNVCKDREIQFVWVNGYCSYECSFTIYDVDGEIICQHEDDLEYYYGPEAGVFCTLTVDCTVTSCMKPSGLTLASKTGPRQAELTWTPGSDDQAAWEISVLDGSSVERIITANTNPFTLTGLTPETTYTVKVRGDCGTEKSRWSSPFTFTTDMPCPTPYSIAVADITPSTAAVNLKGFAYSYEVSYAAMPGCTLLQYDNGVYSTNVGNNSTNWWTWGVMYPGAPDDYTYLSRVFFYEGYCSPASDFTVNIYTGDDEPDTWLYYEEVSPFGHNGLHEVVFDTPVAITPGKNLWIMLSAEGTYIMTANNQSEPNPNSQWIYFHDDWQHLGSLNPQLSNLGWLIRGIVQKSETIDLNWSTATTTDKRIELTGLTPATTYLVKVRGNYDTDGYSNWATSTFVTLNTNPIPFDVAVTVSPTTADISWKGYSDCYKVRYRTAESVDIYGLSSSAGNWMEVTTTGNVIELTNLSDGTLYEYQIVGMKSGFEDVSTDIYTFTTSNLYPVPTNLAVSNVAYSRATLSWTAGADDQTAWDIGYKSLNEADYTVLTGITDNTYTLEGLLAETKYMVMVRGNYGGSIVSKWSEVYDFTTAEQFLRPTALSVEGVTESTATLAWTAGSTETAWQIAYSTDATFNPETCSTKVEVTTNPFTLTGLSTGETYQAAIRANYGDGHYSKWTAITSFVPRNELTVYAGTQTNGSVPMYVQYFHHFTRSQYIIPASDLSGIENSVITGLRYYTTFEQGFSTAPIDVFLTEVDATAISTFADKSTSTTVYQGTVSFVPVNGQCEVTIIFATPYTYQGGNLLIGIENTSKGDSRNIVFYGQSVTGASVAGVSVFNLVAVSFERTNFIPKTTLFYVPDDDGLKKPRRLTATDLSNNSVVLSWTDRETGADTWEMEITKQSNGQTTTQVVSENPCQLSGLEKETEYAVRVRVKKGTEYSYWSNQVTFTTYKDNFKVMIAAGDWDAEDNWRPAGIPTVNDVVYLSVAATVPSGVTASADEIILQGGGQLTVKDGGQLKTRNDVERVTMEKDITGYGNSRGRHYLVAPPVEGNGLFFIQDFSSYSADGEMFAFLPTRELEWVSRYDANIGIGPFNGFVYANENDETLRFTGKAWKTQPVEEDKILGYAIAVTYDETKTDDYNGWLLLGNPYPCNCYIVFSDANNNLLPATFYKMNAAGDGFDVCENGVTLAPCEGAFMHYSQSGEVMFYANTISHVVPKVGEQAWPALPEHGVTSNQDASVVAEIALNDMADNTVILADNDRRTVNATLDGRRFWYDDTWNTLTLPFSLNAEETARSPLAGATIKEFDVVNYYDPANVTILGSYDPYYSHFDGETGLLRLYFRDVTAIEAGKPYFFRKNGAAVTLTATAGTQGYDGQGYEHLFDGQYTGRWSSSTTHRGDQPWFVEFSASVPVYVAKYTLFTADNTQSVLGCSPKVWTLYGKRYAGDKWTVIDTRDTDANPSDALFNSNSDQKSYSVAPLRRGAYQYFRLEISQIEGGETMQLGEFLFEQLDYVENPRFRAVGIRNDAPTPVTTKDGGEVSLRGIFNPLEIAANDKSVLFLAGDNNLYYPTYAMTIGAFRAYYQLNGITAKDINHVRMGFDENSQTIGIDSSFFTLHSSFKEGWYTLDGRKLDQEPTRRGVYIKDGRKVVVRGNR